MVFHHFSCMVGTIEEEDETILSFTPRNHMDRTPVEEKDFLANLDHHLNGDVEREAAQPTEKAENLARVAGFGVGVGSLYLQEVLGYPLLVLRRQCQLNQNGTKCHILPFSLFPVILKMHERQGLSIFWKGWGSTCIFKGVSIATEILVFELFQVPRGDENKKIGWKMSIAHESLKGCCLLLTLPLFSASLVESVQTLMVEQPRSMFSFVKDAAYRMCGLYVSRGHGRLLPVYSLVLPSIVYGIVRYSVNTVISSCIKNLYFKSDPQKDNVEEKNMKKIYYTELASNFLASFLTEMLMYPLETCFLRLHLQGTRTIIDDTDKGLGVVPLCTNYEDPRDCVNQMHRQEGIVGFYKGFGALVLQYAVHFIILKSTKLFYRNT